MTENNNAQLTMDGSAPSAIDHGRKIDKEGMTYGPDVLHKESNS